MNREELKQRDQTYVMATYSRADLVAESGKSATIRDVSGREYIDFGSGIGVMSLGYGDPEWADAVAKQAAKLAHASNLYYTLPDGELAESLCRATGMRRVFFGNSGAEANEGAIKTARKYSFDKYGKGRDLIITLQDSFHGRTVTTLAATGQDVFHNYFFPFTEGFRYVPVGDVEALRAAADGKACAVMIESIQGESGVTPLPVDYVKAIAALCEERDLLLICDEVQAGMGRTGKLMGYEHYGLHPDIVTLAKGLGGGLPIGAFLCNEKTASTMGGGQHGSTFGGNPVVCAGGSVVLKRLLAPGFLESVTEKGAYLQKKLSELHLPCVREIRGKGLMLGLELSGVENKEVAAELLEKGLVVLTAGKNTVRLLPPLVITYEELDRGIAILKDVLSA